MFGSVTEPQLMNTPRRNAPLHSSLPGTASPFIVLISPKRSEMRSQPDLIFSV